MAMRIAVLLCILVVISCIPRNTGEQAQARFRAITENFSNARALESSSDSVVSRILAISDSVVISFGLNLNELRRDLREDEVFYYVMYSFRSETVYGGGNLVCIGRIDMNKIDCVRYP